MNREAKRKGTWAIVLTQQQAMHYNESLIIVISVYRTTLKTERFYDKSKRRWKQRQQRDRR